MEDNKIEAINKIIKYNKEIKNKLSEQNMLLSNIASSHNKESVEEAYQRGVNDAWDAARKIVIRYKGRFTTNEFLDIFEPYTSFKDVLYSFSGMEVIDKIKKYDEKKCDEEIQIGDEVIPVDAISEPYVVTDLSNNCVYGIGKTGNYRGCNRKESRFVKTGRSFPEVTLLLKKMNS